MLRVLRTAGIVFFTVCFGLLVFRLRDLPDSGLLFEEYNRQRNSFTTYLLFSVFGAATLGYFELSHLIRRQKHPDCIDSSVADDESTSTHLSSTSIYSRPKTVDKWEGRKISGSNLHQYENHKSTKLWMGLLRIHSIVIPVVYAFLLMACLSGWKPFLTNIFGFMFVFSILTGIGLVQRKPWGLRCGYAIAIAHLLAFPFGSAAGLILVIGLVGSAPLFVVSKHEHQPKVG